MDTDAVERKLSVAQDWEYSEGAARDAIVADIAELLFHEYEHGGYEGSAFTLFRNHAGELMECNGSHCSCYGLEGQWSPEPTFREALEKRNWYGVDQIALGAVIARLPKTLGE